MSKYSSHDDYLDTVSGVLKNRLGLTDTIKLEETEAALAAARSFDLARKPLAGNFDLAHLKAMHRYLFGDVYEWAGQIRTIDSTKGDSRFANYQYIETAANAVFQKLAGENYLAGLPEDKFSERAAYYLGEINALHPFREGNGRAQREFISHLAYKNGFYIEWQHMTQEEMVQASIESFKGDCSKFAAYIRHHIRKM